MRITVDIDHKKLRPILKLTRQMKKSPAVAQALDEFIEQRQRQEFLAKVMAGETDCRTSNDELESFTDLSNSCPSSSQSLVWRTSPCSPRTPISK